MSFDGTEGGSISQSVAAAMTAEYRRLNPNQTKAHFMGKDILQDILDQEGCEGIRVYYGIDTNGEKQMVFVGADSNEEDILDLIGDLSKPCPKYCGINSPLNS